MPQKKKLRKERARLAKLKAKELEDLKKLRLEHPDFYRTCGENKQPCCQARTLDGYRCSRPAMTSRTYINRIKCCLLCAQHSLGYGIYGLLKVAQMAAESSLDWNEYCFLYPEKCEKYFELQEEYT